MTDEAKLRAVAALMASVEAMGWSAALQEGDEAIWLRWQAIRRSVLARQRASSDT